MVMASSSTTTSDTQSTEHGRDRILRQAAELFLSGGYAETSLRTIADAVEMRPASIYHHFESKDALLSEILDIGMDAITTAFTASADELPADASGAERLRAHVAGHLRALFANHAFTAAHVTVFPFAPVEVRAASVPQRDAYEAMWTELLSTIAPSLDDQALGYARLALFGAMNSTVQWFDPTNGSTDDLAAAISGTLWNGLANS